MEDLLAVIVGLLLVLCGVLAVVWRVEARQGGRYAERCDRLQARIVRQAGRIRELRAALADRAELDALGIASPPPPAAAESSPAPPGGDPPAPGWFTQLSAGGIPDRGEVFR